MSDAGIDLMRKDLTSNGIIAPTAAVVLSCKWGLWGIRVACSSTALIWTGVFIVGVVMSKAWYLVRIEI